MTNSTKRMSFLGELAGIVLAVALVACGGGKAPEPTTPEPAATEPAEPAASSCGVEVPETPEQCECLGGTVKPDPGDGSVQCGDGERELGKVRLGIEGGLCCAPVPSDTAEAATEAPAADPQAP